VEELRADLRRQLGLEPIPDTVTIPRSGPGRAPAGRNGRAEGECGAGGGAGGGLAAGGVAVGVVAADQASG
jgi:hypothetical protein